MLVAFHLSMAFGTGAALAADKPVRTAFIGFAANNVFTKAGFAGLEAAAKEAGNVEVDFSDVAFDDVKAF